MLKIIVKRPFGSSFIICLLSYLTAGIFFSNMFMEPEEATFILVAGIIASCAQNYMRQILILLCALLLFLCHILIFNSMATLLLTEIFLVIIVLYIEKKNEYALIIGITSIAFLCHLFYIQQTPINIRQHDLNGIFLYMNNITQGGFNGIDFNPWNMYYLFHQPLHFVIAGYLFMAGSALWQSTSAAAEGLQYLSLFYVTITSIFAIFILKEFRLTKKIFYTALLLFMFNPTLFLFSGYISDDTPALMWSFITTYFLLRWYKTEKSRYISAAAVGFGLGVLTKLSVLMAVPAIIFLFLCKISSPKKKRADIFADLCLFTIIAIPLALCWIVRNHVLYDMQFYNIPDTSPGGQNFRYQTLGERIFDFSQLLNPFISAPTIVDANIWLALIKTELFGEWDMSVRNSFIYTPAQLLYLLGISLKICTVISVFYLFYRSVVGKLHKNKPFIGFLIVLYVTLLAYSFKYALDYPYICSTDYRLFAQFILPETGLLCLCATYTLHDNSRQLPQQTKVQKKISVNFLTILICIYALLSVFIYIYGL